MSRVVEAMGTLDERGRLVLDEPISGEGPLRVRVIVLLPDDVSGDPSDDEWLAAAARSPSFDFLNHQREDVYSSSDGRPFVDAG